MKYIASIIFSIGLIMPLSAKINMEKYHQEILEMTVDENISHPDVPKKFIPAVNARMALLGGQFMSMDCVEVDLTERSGMVLMLTIPASEFFAPNDTIVRTEGMKYLQEIAKHISVPDQYKLLVTVHSDDTGSDEYLSDLTRIRSEAIVARFAELEVDTKGIVSYGMGYDEPLNTQQTRAGRAANRRVEFYMIPGPAMIDELK